jgi:hypothetical protein
MILEVQAQILGDRLIVDENIEFKNHPYLIRILLKDDKYFLSFQKKLIDIDRCVPTLTAGNNGIPILTLPPEDFYQDIICVMQHIESFGALDNKLQRIDWENLTLKWMPENENEHVSPLSELSRKIENNRSYNKISNEWLFDTVIHRKQLGDLFIPFAFYRDATILFYDHRYQSAFCTFYMMLEYFFHEKSWGIKYDAYSKNTCLNTCLIDTLNELPSHKTHHIWLTNELKRRGKEYNKQGLLFLLNRFRNELSHAVDMKKNRNVFNDQSFFSLSFVAMTLCLFVSIKQRLLPFVSENYKEEFLGRTKI